MKQHELMRDAVLQLGGNVNADEAALLFIACSKVPNARVVIVGNHTYGEPELRLIAWLEDVGRIWFRTEVELLQAYGWACANPHADPPETRREALRCVTHFMRDTRLTISQLSLVVSVATGTPIGYEIDYTQIVERIYPSLSETGRKTLTAMRLEDDKVAPEAVALSATIEEIRSHREEVSNVG